jgi:hypothetical protein
VNILAWAIVLGTLAVLLFVAWAVGENKKHQG